MMFQRLLVEEEEDETIGGLFNIAVATIFAREVLEASIIIGQYRNVIFKSNCMSEERKRQAINVVTTSTIVAVLVAVVMLVIVAIPLAILSNDLSQDVAYIIEGVSKIVAAICVVQLSVKIPVWLNIYRKVSIFDCSGRKYDPNKEIKLDSLSDREIYFNVAWNIWREVAECGVFLLPFFLGGEDIQAIPLSAVAGSVISLALGVGMYYANNRMTTKIWLFVTMSGVTLFLSVGLFMGGCHKFEQVYGETHVVWEVKNDFWSHYDLPMTLLKPFGYSARRTVLQIVTYWGFLLLGLVYHFLKWRNSEVIKALYPDDEQHSPDVVPENEKGPIKVEIVGDADSSGTPDGDTAMTPDGDTAMTPDV